MQREMQIQGCHYEKSQSVIAQGNAQIRHYHNLGFYEAQGGYGTYRMNKPSVAKIIFDVEGERKEQSVKELIRQYYGVSRVTEKKLEDFTVSCIMKEIDLRYSDEDGLYIHED